MTKRVLLAVAVSACLAALAARDAVSQDSVQGGMINLGCMEGLVAIEQSGLAGVFSFIADKDSSAAFADLLAHHQAAMKKYVAKLDRDFKAAAAITVWDHEVVLTALALYSGPLASTLEKPSKKVLDRLTELSMAPTMSLQDMAQRRKK